MPKIILLLMWIFFFYNFVLRTKISISACVQPEYQEIQKIYVENLTSSYPNYTIEGNYYWSGFSITLCIILGAFWAFNLYKLFTGYNTFQTLGFDMFWSTINIGGRSLPRPITLFFNKLALLALTALLIAFCYLDLPNYSSAFEVWINGERVWSKLKTGHMPTLEALHYIIFFELPRIRAKNICFLAVLGLVALILQELAEDKQPRPQALRRIRKTPQRAIR